MQGINITILSGSSPGIIKVDVPSTIITGGTIYRPDIVYTNELTGIGTVTVINEPGESLVEISGAIGTKKYIQYIGDNSSIQFNINHNLGISNLIWSIQETGVLGQYVYPTVSNSGINNLIVNFASGWAPSVSQYQMTIIG